MSSTVEETPEYFYLRSDPLFAITGPEEFLCMFQRSSGNWKLDSCLGGAFTERDLPLREGMHLLSVPANVLYHAYSDVADPDSLPSALWSLLLTTISLSLVPCNPERCA